MDSNLRIYRLVTLTAFLLLGAMSACQYISPVSTSTELTAGIKVTNHPKPDLKVDTEIFTNAGCPLNKYGYQGCLDNSPLASLGCDSILEPTNLLGALQPSYPLILCLVEPVGTAITQMVNDGNYFVNIGCQRPMFVRYVIFQNNEYQLIKNEQEFREVFNPIESPNEALSYALAVTGLSAYYGLEEDTGYRYFVDLIEDTHVVETERGYEVLLYKYIACGCGPHTTSAVSILVTPQGQLNQIDMMLVFEDPKEDKLCID